MSALYRIEQLDTGTEKCNDSEVVLGQSALTENRSVMERGG